MNSKTKLILVSVAIAILAGIAWAGLYYTNLPKVYEFAGKIVKIEGNTIFLSGIYQSNDRPELVDQTRDVQVTVTPGTVFIKTTIKLPSAEELKKTEGFYSLADLPRVEGFGSLEDVVASQVDGIFVKSVKSIYNQSKFEASEIRYYPQEQ